MKLNWEDAVFLEYYKLPLSYMSRWGNGDMFSEVTGPIAVGLAPNAWRNGFYESHSQKPKFSSRRVTR